MSETTKNTDFFVENTSLQGVEDENEWLSPV